MILLMTTAPPLNAPWIHGRKLPPLGLAYVGAALEEAGFQVEILDNYLLGIPIDEIKQIVKKKNPSVVGIACSSATYQRCVETANAVKEVVPSCKVVVGGPHPSFMPETMLQHKDIDYVVLGEGESTIVELVNTITKEKNTSAINNIPGLAFRQGERIVKNAQNYITDLNQLPFPARHLLPMDLYARKMEYLNVEPVDTMNVIRGCPFSCSYCDVNQLGGRLCRAFSPQKVVGEIEQLIRDFGTQGIYFVGDNFTINKDRTLQICKLIKKRKLNIEWVCDTRVDLVSRELLREMRSAGCQTLWFGVESGSPQILEKIKKGITLEQAFHAFELCKEEGIKTACSFMLGIPGETINDMDATLKTAKKLNPDWCQFNIFVAYPNSILYKEILENKLYDRIEDFIIYIKTKDFDYEMVNKIQRRFHRSFNRTPKRVVNKIRKEGILTVLKNGIKLFSGIGEN